MIQLKCIVLTLYEKIHNLAHLALLHWDDVTFFISVQARLQREAELKQKAQTVDEEKKKIETKLKEVRDRVKKEEAEGGENLEDLKKSLLEVERTAKQVEEKKVEVDKEMKKQPLNVDSLSKDGWSKTLINTQPRHQEQELSEEERESKMKKFVKENEKEMKEYGMLQKFDDSKKYLMDGKTHLACEETANYLVIWLVV